MPEYLSPGTYVEEVRGDVVPIQGVSTSTAGFVGLTQRGPTQPMLITSWPEYTRWYGGLIEPSVSALPWSVQGFFANGGQRVFVARVVRSDAKTASLTLTADGAPTITALGPGAWGNDVHVQVAVSVRDANRFRLTVSYQTLTEDFDQLSTDPKDSRYAPSVVNAGSHLVSLAFPAGTAAAAPAAVATTPLAGGDDGSAALTSAAFKGDPSQPPNQLTGLAALAVIDDIAILAVPDAVNPSLAAADQNDLVNAVVDQCEQLRDRVAVLDIPPGAGNIANNPNTYVTRRSDYSAIYFPHLRVIDPVSRTTALVPPSGFVAGIYANNDITRGVHKAPANYQVAGILNADISPTEGPLEFPVTKGMQDELNPAGVNCFRDFRPAGNGIRLWGARTTSSDPEWTYVNVRRLFIFVEKSVDRGLQWLVFEPNAEPTWAKVRRTLDTFLENVWRSGALMGTTKEEAYFVRCDRTTMSTDDILNGRLVCLIGLAAVRPAEFVILRFSQFTSEATQ
ncbi:phage tail sheath family protein [Kitasatospora acidiphila]|uniref:Phage tail sheath family protein n=1 Tax=Kitasatospora acidiphila TaxID=2567942 RepID=A0A540WD37_9ACTN|nr:phage tail sheath subtilisin-like domain-containing protein [Kitasatospora acidiphila]TQF06862.1 phage tail sheath family protein [Kitasatospora acidiphila]